MPPFPEIIVTVPIRSDTVHFSTVQRTLRSPTEMYDIVPCVFNTVQYGTPCNQDSVHVTVPFSFVQGLKTSKSKNTHLRNKYNKKFSRTTLIVPRIIDQSKDTHPHLDQGLILDPLKIVTMGPVCS